MVQRKFTPVTRDGSKGTTNFGGKGRGSAVSLLARASNLNQNSSSRQQSQGKGGSNRTTTITGPTDNINKGGRKGVDTEVAQEKKTADGRGRNKTSQGTPQESYKDVLTQLKEHAAQRAQTNLSGGGGNKIREGGIKSPPSLPKGHVKSGHPKPQDSGSDKEGGKSTEEGTNKRRSRSYSPPAKTKSRQHYTQEIRDGQETGELVTEGVTTKWQGIGSPMRTTKNYKSSQDSEIMSSDSSLSVKELDLDLEEDKDEDSTNTSMDVEVAAGALGQIKIYMAGTFNIKRYELTGDIKLGGGQVTSNIKEADLVVVGTDLKEKESEFLKDTTTPQIQLELLHKIIDKEVPLSNIIGTPSRVSFATSTTVSQSRDGTASTSGSKYGLPRRIPVIPPQPPSISSPSWTSQSATSQGGSGKGLKIGGGAVKANLNPKYTTLINVRVTFSQAENPAEITQSAISGLLTIFKVVDRHFVLRHLDKDYVGITRPEDVPIIRMLYESYAHFNGATKGELQPFPSPNPDRKRSISFTIRVGTSIPMSKVIDETIWELSSVVDGGSINVEIKALQEIRTETAFIIIASPTFVSLTDLTEVMAQFLQQGINAAKKARPKKYAHLPNVPPFAMLTEFIRGLPWQKEEESDKAKIPPYMRKPIHLMTRTADYDNMKAILGLFDRTDNLKDLFGGGSFIIDNRTIGQGRLGRSEIEVKALQDCMHRHIWANKNTAQIKLRGVRNPDSKARIRKLLTDENGALCNEDEYQVDQQMSLRDVLMRMKVGDTPIFCLVARRDGSYIAFYRNIYDEVKMYAKRFESEPAGYIMYWLLKRGIVEDDIVNFLQTAFDAEEVAAALQTKMEDGVIISQRALEQEKRIARFDSVNPNIDITEAMREAEVTAHKKQLVDSIKETAFHGRGGLTLDEKNTDWGGGSTIYSGKNLTLGGTEFGLEGWDSPEYDDMEDFAGPNWEEDEVRKLRIDTSQMPELEKNMMPYSGKDREDGEGSTATKGSDRSRTQEQIREQAGTLMITVDDDKIEYVMTDEGTTNDSHSGATMENTRQKYLGPSLQDEASDSGEKIK